MLHTVQRADGVLVFSNGTFAEVHDRLLKPKFDRYVTHEGRAVFLGHLVAMSEWVSISQAKLGCRDPDDDKLLETALAGEATCLVIGDRDVLTVHPFQSIPILDPATFLLERS